MIMGDLEAEDVKVPCKLEVFPEVEGHIAGRISSSFLSEGIHEASTNIDVTDTVLCAEGKE
jgi:hypothetical protein